MIRVTKWRYFTKVDWFGFDGSEPFSSGEEPIWVDFPGGDILADANGLCLFPTGDEECKVYWQHTKKLGSTAEALEYVKSLTLPWINLEGWEPWYGNLEKRIDAIIQELTEIKKRYA